MNERLMRLEEVLKRIPISKTSWYQGIREGRYPKPVRLGPRMVAWKSSEIEELIKNGAQK